jgi:hypothetical protein
MLIVWFNGGLDVYYVTVDVNGEKPEAPKSYLKIPKAFQF